MEYVSKLESAIAIVGYVMRYVKRLKECQQYRKKYSGSAPASRPKRGEIALHELTADERMGSYGKEITALKEKGELPEKNKIESLRPVFDKNNNLCVGGRLARSDMDSEKKHPVIIPNQSRLAWLIIESAHRMTKHGSVQVMMQFVLHRFWIPKRRSGLRNFLHKFAVCARYNYKLE